MGEVTKIALICSVYTCLVTLTIFIHSKGSSNIVSKAIKDILKITDKTFTELRDEGKTQIAELTRLKEEYKEFKLGVDFLLAEETAKRVKQIILEDIATGGVIYQALKPKLREK